MLVCATESTAFYTLLTSFPFELLTRRQCSTLETRLRFVPTDVFPYFPFPWRSTWDEKAGRPSALPPSAEAEASLGPVMQELLAWREKLLLHPDEAGLLADRPKGPTDLYNLFDNPEVTEPAIEHLRGLHRGLLKAVTDLYGWNDFRPNWVFDRPWIDGTNRYVPSTKDRADLLARLAELATKRREEDLALILERMAPLARNGTTVNALLKALKSAGFGLSKEEVVAALEFGTTQGVVANFAGTKYSWAQK